MHFFQILWIIIWAWWSFRVRKFFHLKKLNFSLKFSKNRSEKFLRLHLWLVRRILNFSFFLEDNILIKSSHARKLEYQSSYMWFSIPFWCRKNDIILKFSCLSNNKLINRCTWCAAILNINCFETFEGVHICSTKNLTDWTELRYHSHAVNCTFDLTTSGTHILCKRIKRI